MSFEKNSSQEHRLQSKTGLQELAAADVSPTQPSYNFAEGPGYSAICNWSILFPSAVSALVHNCNHPCHDFSVLAAGAPGHHLRRSASSRSKTSLGNLQRAQCQPIT